MDLVDKQDRPLLVHATQILGLRHDFLHIFLSGNRRIDLPELRAGRVGDHPRKRRLSRSRRTVDDGDILGAQHLVDGVLLRGVKPRQTDVAEGVMLQRYVGVAHVAQMRQTRAPALYHTVEGIEHAAVARLVERQLHAKTLRLLKQGGVALAAKGYYHLLLFGIRDGGCHIKVMRL